MKNILYRYLDWTRPLAETAAEALRKLARGAFPADFSHLVVAVPTAEAGRLLRERVAEFCADAGGAVNLHVIQPEQILNTGETAGQVPILMAWLETLRGADGRDFPELFRNGVLDRFRDSDDILLGWGEALQHARTTLAREGLSLADAAGKLDALCRESASETGECNFTRFREFAVLEGFYLSRLKRRAGERVDPAAAMLGAIESPQLPENVETVVLIDCADLAGAPERWLDRAGVAVECWINAPEEYREHFDGFGRPDPEFWNAFPLDLDPAERVRIVPRPDRQAKKILEMLTDSPGLPSAVAVLDPEVVSALETHAAVPGRSRADGRKIEFFIPRETVLATLPWSQLLLAVIRSARDGRVADAAAVWGDPLFADYARRLGVGDLKAALAELDQLRSKHLAVDTEFVRKLLGTPDDGPRAALVALLAELERWRDRIAQSAHPVTAAYGILAEIGGAVDVGHLDLRRSEGEIAHLRELVAALDRIDAPAEALFSLLRRMLAATRFRIREEPPGAIDVIGFLEVPWRTDSPVLIAGFNDAFLSAGTTDDMFLPDQARAALGMNTCDRRRAADALRFAALLKRTGGEVYVLCGDSSHNGDKLFPARLLLQCGRGNGDGADELARRTDLLFGETRALVEDVPPPAAAPKIMRMNEGAAENKRMSITGFSAYIRCPFTFFLERMRDARHCDVDSPELDNPAFGTLVHSVLQELRRFEAQDAPELEASLAALLKKLGEREFGFPPPGLLQLQLDMLRESLHYFAGVQSAEYRDGWRIVKPEYRLQANWDELYRKVFPASPPESWRAQLTLVGTIDRIDRRIGDDGAVEVRVLDYKTAAAGADPADAHLGKYSGPEDDHRLSAAVDDKGNRLCWKDLQLPLYVLLVRHFVAGGEVLPKADRIVAGYFDLPQVFTDTGVRMFDALNDGAVLESAASCADNILRRIFVEEKFWPPAGNELELFPGSRVAVADFRDPAAATEVRP